MNRPTGGCFRRLLREFAPAYERMAGESFPSRFIIASVMKTIAGARCSIGFVETAMI